VRQLTASPALEFQPSWSPDGRQIAYAGGDVEGNGDIYVVNADGTEPRQLTDDPGRAQQPAWSPDGEWILFASDREGGRGSVFLMRPDGSSQQNLTPEGGDGPAWAP
jgi:TolB protein